jgi:hypothetical protein
MCKAWPPDFPKVMHFIDQKNCYAKPWRILTEHPDYDAAKNHQDREAAARLVKDLLGTPENQAQLALIAERFPNAIIVPVHGIEANGRNRIPEMLAEYIGKRTGLEINADIVQTNEVHRTGSDSWHRFAFRPEFDGEVQKGRQYILTDDVFSNGGSFSELRQHIEKGGGQVVQTAAVTLGGHGEDIAMLPASKQKLLDKFGEDKVKSFLQEMRLYDGNYEGLTEPEVYALTHTATLDEGRSRIIEARQTGRTRDSQETVRGCETTQIKLKKDRDFCLEW